MNGMPVQNPQGANMQLQNEIQQCQQRLNQLQQQQQIASQYSMSPNPWNSAAPLQSVVTQNPQSPSVPKPSLPDIRGKVINTEDDIVAKEIPMDGSVSLFLRSDLQSVYAKAWNAKTGLIDSVEYVLKDTPQAEAAPAMSTSEFQTEIVNRFDRLEQQIMQLKNQNGKNKFDKQQNQNGPKKEHQESIGFIAQSEVK